MLSSGRRIPSDWSNGAALSPAFFDGRWWQPERPRVHPLNNDVGDPVYNGWIWEIDREGIWHPIAAPRRTTAVAESVPGTMLLVSRQEAHFRRPGLSRRSLLPAGSEPAVPGRQGGMTVAALHRLPGVWGLLLVPLGIGGFVLGQVTGDKEYRQTSVDWTVVAVSDDNMRLTISYETGDLSCHADKIDVFEASLAVRIRVFVREEVGRDCGDERITRTTDVRLEAPFADLWDSRGKSVLGENGRVGGIGRGT